MKLKYWLLGIYLITCANGWAQFNDYKYIVVPKRFEAFKSTNQHNTSVFIKYLLVQQGFNVVYDDAQPPDLRIDPCLGVQTVLNDNSSLLATKVVIDLLNCKNELVFTTREGRSKKKDYKASYSEAIEEAMQSFAGLRYQYNEVQESESQKAAEEAIAVEPPAPLEVTSVPDTEEVAEEKIAVVSGIAKTEKELETKADIWYAQETATGFQLVDSSPRIRMKLHKTSLADVYLAETDDNHGLVYQKNEGWWFEHYQGDSKQRTKLNIRF